MSFELVHSLITKYNGSIVSTLLWGFHMVYMGYEMACFCVIVACHM